MNERIEKMKDVVIEHYSDGWTVRVGDKCFCWDHYEEDLGADAIGNLLKYLGHNVTIEDCY
jgi:hypothetical protein